jgi:DNA segregation ATPase FtsK/SpoIIIE, S-DNA-T family
MARSKTSRKSWFDRSGRSEKGGRKPFLSPAMRQALADRSSEALGFLFGLVALVLIAALLSYSASDPSANTNVPSGVPIHNLLGLPGAWFADFMIQWFGFAAYLPPLLIMAWGWRLSLHRPVRRPYNRIGFGVVGVLLASVALAGTVAGPVDPLAPVPGGAVGILLLSIFSRFQMPWYLPAGSAGVAAGVALFLAAGI